MGILLIVVVFVFVGAIALALPLGIALLGREERMQKRSEEQAPELLDAAFDGDETVVLDVTARSMRYETVMRGAIERGYRLLNESADVSTHTRTLVFTLAD